MTLQQLAESKALQWGKDGDYLTIERLKLHIISARATIIQRRYDATKVFPQSIIMTLRCQDIIRVDADECDCFTTSGYLWRSKNKIPLPIIVKDDSYFMFVGEVKGRKSFSAITPDQVQDIEHRTFSKNEFFYFYSNSYLYFTKPLAGFTTRFVPENPLEILKLGECNTGCIEDGELIIESSLEEGILGLLDSKRPMILEGLDTDRMTIDGDN